MVQVDTGLDAPPYTYARCPAVYTRVSWGDAWAQTTGLYCDRLTLAAAPGLSRAELTLRYGVGIRYGEQTYAQAFQQELRDRYVKIVPHTGSTFAWVGIITDEIRDDYGPLTAGGIKPNGVQRFLAVGLELLLERTTIETGVYYDANYGGPRRLGRALGFNDRTGDSAVERQLPRGNRKAAPEAGGVYVFAGDLSTAEEWTATQIVEHLLEWHSPKDGAGVNRVEFILDSGGPDLAWLKPTLRNVQGRSLLELLREIYDRRRLLSFYLIYDEALDRVSVNPFTFAPVDILANDDGDVLPANTLPASLNYDAQAAVRSAQLRKTSAHSFQRVIYRGARRTCCCTLSLADGTLAADWSAADELLYEAGASAAAGYAALKTDQKCQRNDQARQAEALRRVYSYFVLPSNWNGLVGDGAGGAATAAFPDLTDPNVLPAAADPLPHFWAGLRLARVLPLIECHDYSGTAIADDTVADSTPTGSYSSPRAPFAAIMVEAGKYQFTERLSANADSELVASGEGGRRWNAQLSMQDAAPGIVLRPSTLPHILAAADFDATQPSDVTADLDYTDGLLATVSIVGDCFAEAAWPDWPVALPVLLDVAKILRVDVGEEFRLDYVAPGTIVDLDDGEPVRSSSGGFVTDDRGVLQSFARIAYDWYANARHALNVTWRQLLPHREIADGAPLALGLGQLVTTIGAFQTEEAIDTPIVSMGWDFLSGETSIETELAQIDPAALRRRGR